MSYTYDAGTDIRRIRLLIPDRPGNGFAFTNDDAPLFRDDELQDFFDLEDGLKRATALALETIAADEALVQKVIRTADVSTDGAATARVLLNRAATLRSQADRDEATSDGGAFDIAEMPGTVFAERERIVKEWQRRG